MPDPKLDPTLNPDWLEEDGSPALRIVQFFGYTTFFAAMGWLALSIVRGYASVGTWWVVALTVIGGYLLADLLSGIVHFLADNFGTPDTPFLGQGFVLPFRQHHVDPLGITRHGFFNTNGNNALVCLPLLIPVALWVPVTSSSVGFAAGVFTWVTLFAVFLTNQTHKWAHMPDVPKPIAWMQAAGLILRKDHHDIHHVRPYNTHYCITVGAWNSLFERYQVFDRAEKLIRRWVPGISQAPPVDQKAAQDLMMHATRD
ncbi:MAG: fatty acid desaturase CarF family protein [Gemmatimonadaceae bacterium]